MLLAFVSIQNYRGIRSLKLPIGPTTTLIGENAYGKSNLLDALLVCLGVGAIEDAFAFLPGDFQPLSTSASVTAASLPSPVEASLVNLGKAARPSQSAPIVIELGFRETDHEEWEGDAACARLRTRVYLGPRGDRRLTYRILALLDSTGGEAPPIQVEHSFVNGRGEAIGAPAEWDDLRLLRQRAPFLLLKADRYFVRPSRVPTQPTDSGEARSLSIESRLAEEVMATFLLVADSHRPVDSATLERGVEAAQAYVARFGGDRLTRRLQRFLDPRGSTEGTGVSSAVRSVALMLVFGALFEARAERIFGARSNPVLAIEDAEASLHPVVLASVATLIQAMPTQKLITTNSGELLSMLPLPSIRRLVPDGDATRVYRVGRHSLSDDEWRRIGYHVRAHRGTSLFARCWLLVEGETEFWLLPEFASLLGHDFALEGVRCMEFAQCGIPPLVKLADDLGIAWHVLADGDRSGETYADSARAFLNGRADDDHLTRIRERDIEHMLWASGFADVYRTAIPSAAPRRFDRRPRVENPTPTIERAIRARSKPGMALEVIEHAQRQGAPGVPRALAHAIERSVALARATVR